MGLTKAAITRPIFIFMLMAAAFLLGTISYRGMRVELQPEVAFGIVTVSTVYPGAGPEEINNLVSRPVEESISGVNGLREVTSTSLEGVSIVVAQFELGTNTDVAMTDVRSKVDGITNSLPTDALKPTISKLDITAQAVEILAFNSSRLSSRELRDLLDEKISDKFAQIPGVAAVNVQGGDTREVQIQLKKDKLLSYGLGILDVQQQVQAASLNAPAGRLVNGEREFTVRMPKQFETLDDVKDMVLRVSDPNNPMAKGRTIRLTDVANVTDSIVERADYARLNGSDTIVLAIQKAREGNAVEIAKAAEKIIDQVQKDYAADNLTIVKTFEQASMIENSLASLNFDLAFAIILVSSIVFVFLHNLRGTIIVAIAIPTSLFATFISLKLFGFTINSMTMLALTLAVGVLVDDAIVVLENIYRHLRMGEEPREAAINGRSEIGLAAMAITMADVVVFLPIAFMGGIVGQFFRPMAVAFVSAVLCSLFVSFTVTPMLASRWYRKGEDLEHPTGQFAVWFEKRFHAFENLYRKSLEWALKHRWFVFITGNITLVAIIMFITGGGAQSVGGAISTGMRLFPAALVVGVLAVVCNLVFYRRFVWRPLLGAVFFGLVFPISAVLGYGYGQWKDEAVFKFSFMPNSDANQVSAKIELPPGTSLSATEEVVRRVEAVMMKNPDVKHVVSNVGSQGAGGVFGGGNSGSNYANVSATLYDKASLEDRALGVDKREKLRYRTSASLTAELTRQIGRIPGAQINVSESSGMGLGSALSMSFRSDDRVLMQKGVDAVRTALVQGAVKGVINVDVSTKLGKPELQVIPDRTLLADAGISVATAAGALRTLYQGNDNTKLRVAGKEYTVRVMMDLDDRNDPDLLKLVPLAFNQGSPIYLENVAKIQQRPGVNKIERRNREEEVRISADLLPGFAAGTVQAEIDAYIAKNKLVPEGVKYQALGQADFQARESGFLFGALGIGLVLVYMLLASLYDNLLYPFIIQMAQPQAMVGAILALVLTDKAMSLVAMIGLITLTGLVGKNAILLVDYANTLRSRGRNRHDALVEAGPTRLRPIMMTTLALIFGLMPIAFAIGRGSEFRETLGIAIIGGMILSTALTLLVIPCSYTIFDDMSNLLSRLTHRGRPVVDPDA